MASSSSTYDGSNEWWRHKAARSTLFHTGIQYRVQCAQYWEQCVQFLGGGISETPPFRMKTAMMRLSIYCFSSGWKISYRYIFFSGPPVLNFSPWRGLIEVLKTFMCKYFVHCCAKSEYLKTRAFFRKIGHDEMPPYSENEKAWNKKNTGNECTPIWKYSQHNEWNENSSKIHKIIAPCLWNLR